MRIAREGLPFVVAAAIVAAAGAWIDLRSGWLLMPLALFVAWFFRDPHRRTPADSDWWFSPADGRILQAGPERVSIFMNVFNVHVCRAPAAGVVASARHFSGRFLAAFRDEASEHNERVTIEIEGDRSRIRFTLVAGLIARRIVCRVRAGQRVGAGERIGIIRFGSRVDVDLPHGAEVGLRVGQRVVAGETPIARVARRDEAAKSGAVPAAAVGRTAGEA